MRKNLTFEIFLQFKLGEIAKCFFAVVCEYDIFCSVIFIHCHKVNKILFILAHTHTY